MIADDELEASIIAHATRRAGRRLASQELAIIALHLLRQQQHAPARDRTAAILLRLAARANPYGSSVADIIEARRHAIRARVESDMPALLAHVSGFAQRQVPIPLIISCTKYLPKAVQAAALLARVYFGLAPIIIRGDRTAPNERFEDGVLTLPVADTYEALPHKVFETFLLFDAMGAPHGVLKIDDDLRLTDETPLDLEQTRSAFANCEYMGLALASVFHDRAWHEGKCASPVASIYGKPFLAPWARGALYFLSASALSLLCAHYTRFPGCLAGELYEDKAVGDTLFQLGLRLTNRPLEPILQISTDAPERSAQPSEEVPA